MHAPRAADQPSRRVRKQPVDEPDTQPGERDVQRLGHQCRVGAKEQRMDRDEKRRDNAGDRTTDFPARGMRRRPRSSYRSRTRQPVPLHCVGAEPRGDREQPSEDRRESTQSAVECPAGATTLWSIHPSTRDPAVGDVVRVLAVPRQRPTRATFSIYAMRIARGDECKRSNTPEREDSSFDSRPATHRNDCSHAAVRPCLASAQGRTIVSASGS